MRVEHLMTRTVLSVEPETPLKAVAALLAAEHISGVPVVAAGEVVGIVSETDIVRVEQGGTRRRGGVLAWLLNAADSRDVRVEARTAAEAMTSPPITVSPGRSVAEAARLMIERGVTRLPVVVDGALVGIVTRGDLVRAFARSDEEIEHEIYDDVLARTFWVAPERVAVHVVDGVVSLEGETETRTAAELIEAFVRRVPGVSIVESALVWTVDDLHERPIVGPGEPLH
jgi:CBS domain-containing protein